MNVRIRHVSDNHGELNVDGLNHGDYDITVVSGDFLPDDLAGPAVRRGAWLKQWVNDEREKLTAFFGKAPVLWCSGNHDYVTPDMEFFDLGISFIDVTDRLVKMQFEVNGDSKTVSFYGFPWINWINGSYAYEATPPMMKSMLQAMEQRLAAGNSSENVDVFIAHAPLVGHHNIDGTTGIDHGVPELTDYFAACEIFGDRRLPIAYLHGHIHSPGSSVFREKMHVFNSATSIRIIDIDFNERQAKLVT